MYYGSKQEGHVCRPSGRPAYMNLSMQINTVARRQDSFIITPAGYDFMILFR